MVEKEQLQIIFSDLEKNNISLYKVAKESGISTMTLSRWKRGQSSPKKDLFSLFERHIEKIKQHKNNTNADSILEGIFENFEINKISLYEISKKTKISYKSIWDWKRGISKPRPESLDNLRDFHNSIMLSNNNIKIIKKSSFDGVIPLVKKTQAQKHINIIEGAMSKFSESFDINMVASNPGVIEKFRDQLKEFSEKIEEMYLDRHDVF